MTKEKIKKEKIKEIRIQPILLENVTIPIRGKTPLLMDKVSSEIKNDIIAKQTGKVKSIKKIRDIKKEQRDSIHRTNDGRIGFPVVGFKKGMIEATSFVGDKMFSKKLIKGVKILNAVDGLIPIKFKKQDILEHNIDASKTKFTPQFHKWSCELKFQFDSNNISVTDLVVLLNYAGFYSGLGVWAPRSQCGGDFGMYEVAKK